jgi:hypothetical protein
MLYQVCPLFSFLVPRPFFVKHLKTRATDDNGVFILVHDTLKHTRAPHYDDSLAAGYLNGQP